MPILHWLTREEDLKAAAHAPYRLLEADPALSYGDADSGNMLIQGDNLDALKALLPYYAGQVKCIYIDPPYNTRSAFEHYDDNIEHTQWLAMIYPRLELLRELLSEDGSIWVSIDDNEGHYLKVVMDEVFGRQNFLTTFVWKKSYGGGAKARWFVGLHEFTLCYAKNLPQFPDMFLPPDPDAVKKYYKYQDNKLEERGPYRLQPLATTSNDDRPNLRYAIPHPNGGEIWPEKQWQWSKERALEALKNDELVIRKKGNGYTVSYKQYLKDPSGKERRRKPKSIIEGHYTQHGTAESVALFGQDNKFAFPKPEGLIEDIFECCSDEQDLVLDSFLGSGTTAAVAHKMNRRWIGIEMGDHAQTHCAPRLQKVIAGEQGGISESTGWQGGGGFGFYRLGEPVFDADGRIATAIAFAPLAAHVWFSETGIPLPLAGGEGPRSGGGVGESVAGITLASHRSGPTPNPVRGEASPGRFRFVRGTNRPRTPKGEGDLLSPSPGPSRKREGSEGSPFLGVHDGRVYALLYNGILGDKSVGGGNVLTTATLAAILEAADGFAGPMTIYGEASRLGEARLRAEGITFKQTPYDVKAG